MNFPGFLATLTLVAAAGGAPALAARVAPLLPAADAPLPGELRERFHDALGRGLLQANATGVEVVSGAEVRQRLSANEALRACASGSCLGDAARELRADRLAVAEISSAGKNYTFTLHLYEPGGAETFHTTERCEICTVREADEALARAAARMGPWLSRPSPVEPPRTPPPPVQAPAPVVAPVVPRDEDAPRPARKNGYRTGWITALTLGSIIGGGLIITSIPFWVYASQEGKTTCGVGVTLQNCPTVYHGNFPAGLGLLVSGVAVAGAGLVTFGVLYVQDRRLQRQRRAELSLSPLPGGGLLRFGGRF